MTQHQNDLAENLLNLFNVNKYTPFEAGYLINQPNLEGAFYMFVRIADPKFCVLINTSGQEYPSNMQKLSDCIFMIYNAESVEYFVENLSTVYLPDILQTINNNMRKKNERNLPYGYYYDENGELKIDIKKANEVRRIYNSYIETESVRKIASEMRTNFSHIRDILHDNEEYMKMQNKILPVTMLKTVNELLAKNVKGTFKQRNNADRLKEAKQRAKRIRKATREKLAQSKQG